MNLSACRSALATTTLALSALSATGAHAQQYAPPPPGPVNSQVQSAPAPIERLSAQPQGVADILLSLASTPATRSAFTFDRDMLQSMDGVIGGGTGALNSVTVENYSYHEPAFYIPENMAALSAAYNAAGWKHLVDPRPSPRDGAAPSRPLTDLWLHFANTEIDHVTVIIRAPRRMSVIEVSGVLRPLDLVHLSGRFGIPKVDPGAVMEPATPGR
ncbi:hypothetical protein [Granulicella paludicola]|uniref:hypothetical protein n=1 Tax=Granulicella paludicola TaxID=474951 RepID=UPI0021E04555|nr:hypothetical protein [Granulicella paludicola]